MATKRKQRNKRWHLLLISLAALALLFVLSLILFRPGREDGEIETAPYALDSSAEQRFAAMDGRLAVASGGGLQLFDENGSLILREAVTLMEPALTVGADTAAAYDIGGKTLVTADFDGNADVMETENAIISARMTRDGWLAVVTESPGYRGLVTVYDRKHTVIYQWYSGTDRVLNAALSENHILAVLCAGAEGSRVHLFAMNSEDERGVFAADELLLDLTWMGTDHLAVLSGERLAFLDDRGVQSAEYSFSGMHLFQYSTGGDGLFTLALSAYRTGGTCLLVTLSPAGKVLAERTVENVTGLDARGKQVLVRTGNVLTLYNQQLEDMRAAEIDALGVRQALLLKSGRALLVYDYSAQAIEI